MRATLPTDGDTGNGWQDRHNRIIDRIAQPYPNSSSNIIATMIYSWAQYAKNHNSRFDSLVGDDYVLGVEWQRIGESLRGLLNGECGYLDCGTLDGFILDTMSENGIDTSKL